MQAFATKEHLGLLKTTCEKTDGARHKCITKELPLQRGARVHKARVHKARVHKARVHKAEVHKARAHNAMVDLSSACGLVQLVRILALNWNPNNKFGSEFVPCSLVDAEKHRGWTGVLP